MDSGARRWGCGNSEPAGLGHVRVKLVKAGLMMGTGGGSGVLTYRGRDYRFRVSGLSLGVTAGASVNRLEGWASGIRQVSDFAGTYSSVGGGGAFVGGFGGVQLGNEKGVRIELRGPRVGMEFAANLTRVRISPKCAPAINDARTCTGLPSRSSRSRRRLVGPAAAI